MNILLVKKIRKPILVIGIAVAMACLLFPFGGTTHQAQAETKDTTHQAQTTSSFDDAMSAIDDQLAQSSQALNTMDNLYQYGHFAGCAVDYYANGINYYNTFVASKFAQWLGNLAGEAQNGYILNGTTGDQNLITNAVQANYAFTTWVDQVASYFSANSCLQQGGYLLAPFSKAILPRGEIIPEKFPSFDSSKNDLSREKWFDIFKKGLDITTNAFGPNIGQILTNKQLLYNQSMRSQQSQQPQQSQQSQQPQQSQQSCFLLVFCL